MKYLNYCKENYYESQPICEAILPLASILFPNFNKFDAKNLLWCFREFDKKTILYNENNV